MLIDSHCHVGEAEYDADRAEVLARARAAGVTAMIVPAGAGTIETNLRAIEVAEHEHDCHAVVGVHPHDVGRMDDALFGKVEELAAHPRVVAIGETGLDFYYEHSARERQEAEFRRFCGLARSLGLPVVVHSRGAAGETLAILREEKVEAGVVHCFTYGADVARAVLDLGLLVSFSGIVTFRKALDVQAAARFVPLDRLLVETDAPFLSPEPRRGGRNEPARVVDVATRIAELRGIPYPELAERTADNARRLFKLWTTSPIGYGS